MIFAFRADGSKTIGLGHVMRCLSLAEALKQNGFECFFITKNYGDAVLELIRSKKTEAELIPSEASLSEDLKLTLKALTARKADAVFVDSYDVEESYLNEIKKTGIFLISIDDKAKLKLPSDLVINPNLGVSVSEYRGVDSSKVLLGPTYAMLRSEFKAMKTKRTLAAIPREILISFGGSDTSVFTEKILKALLLLPESFHITAVLGQGAPDSFAGMDASRVTVKINAGNMAELMAAADLAVLSAGTIAWEAACLGLPALLVQIADNQQKNAEQLDAMGIAVNCGPKEKIHESKLAEHFQKLFSNRFKREQMSAAGQKLVDGNGIGRILSEIKKRTVYEKN